MNTSIIKYTTLILFLFTALQSQEVVVPVSIHLPLLFKAIGLEKNTYKSNSEMYTVAVIYDGMNGNSNDIKSAVLSFSEEKDSLAVGNKNVHFIPVDVHTAKNIDGILQSVKPQAVYIAPLASISVQQITQSSQKEKILSMTGVPEYVDDGVSLGIGIKGDSPEIIINLSSCKEEGIEFSSKVLGLARIIQ